MPTIQVAVSEEKPSGLSKQGSQKTKREYTVQQLQAREAAAAKRKATSLALKASQDGAAEEQPEAATIAADELSDLSWTKIIRGYRVRGADLLGQGSFSIVFRGIHLASGEVVAVKTPLDASSAGFDKFSQEVGLFRLVQRPPRMASMRTRLQSLRGSFRLRLQSTASLPSSLHTVAALKSETLLVRMLDYSQEDDGRPSREESDGRCYVVLQLAEVTLADVIQKCADQGAHFPPSDVATLLQHVGRALVLLGSKGFVHGDIKPANIMWFSSGASLGNDTADGTPPVGAGRWKLIDVDGLLTVGEAMDMTGASFFTPIYCAPELARQISVGGTCRISRLLDVWSLGVLATEMLAFRPPFEPRYRSFCEAGDPNAFFEWLGSDDATDAGGCEGARERPCELFEQVYASVLARGDAGSVALCELLRLLLTPDPAARLSAPEVVEHESLAPAAGLVREGAALRLPAAFADAPPPRRPPRSAEAVLAELQMRLPASAVEEITTAIGLGARELCEAVARADVARHEEESSRPPDQWRNRTAFEFFQLLLFEKTLAESPSRKAARLELAKRWAATKKARGAIFEWCTLLEAAGRLG